MFRKLPCRMIKSKCAKLLIVFLMITFTCRVMMQLFGNPGDFGESRIQRPIGQERTRKSRTELQYTTSTVEAVQIRGYLWEPASHMPIINDDPSVLVTAEHICSDDQKNRVFLLVMIPSAPTEKHSLRRRFIRSTYAGVKQYNGRVIRYVFLLAETNDVKNQEDIRLEAAQYRDIVQFGFLDSFWNLTLKTSAAFHWVNKYCKGARFILKTDDDGSVFIQRIVIFLEWLPAEREKNLFAGGTLQVPPIRVHNKYYVSYKEYPYEMFPPFIRGLGMLFSKSVVRRFSEAARRVPRIRIDDAYVGMLAHYAGVKPECHTGIFFRYDTNGSAPDTWTMGKTQKNKYCSLGNLIIFNSPEHERQALWDLFNEFVDKKTECSWTEYKYLRDKCLKLTKNETIVYFISASTKYRNTYREGDH